MPILDVVLYLIGIGVVLWAVNKYIPMADSIKNILNIVVVVAVVIWLLGLFLPLDHLRVFRTPNG